MTSPPPCPICASDATSIVQSFADLSRVTSDCKPFQRGGELAQCGDCGAPFKPLTPELSAELDAIYSDYDVYYQGGGADQIVFSGDGEPPRRRCEVLADSLCRLLSRPSGRLADIGCGNGAFLHAVKNKAPAWQLNGVEISPGCLSALQTFNGLEKVGPSLKALDGEFDLVSLIHCLEHVADPLSSLIEIKERLSPDGRLFIQCPDFRENPYDLVIADHLNHFSAASLAHLLGRAGFAVESMTKGLVKREISCIALAARQTERRRKLTAEVTASAALAWLAETSLRFRSDETAGPFFIFGTSIAAAWLAGDASRGIAGFIDEDEARQGRRLFDKPIFAPELVPAGARVALALSPTVAASIGARHAQRGWILIPPPELPRNEMVS